MARRTVKPINLDKVMKEIFAEYGDDVFRVLGTAVDQVSEEAVRKLQAGGSFGGTGAYRRDWTSTVEPVGRFKTKRIIHNADHYRLAHLL